MDRIYDIGCFRDTVRSNDSFFRSYLFHSIIDLNLIKLDYILEHGILSRRYIEARNLLSFYVHSLRSYDCKNGFDYISLVDYDKLANSSEGCTFSNMFEAFSLHTLTSLSVMLDRDIELFEKGELESLFDDEVFAKDEISNSHIKGIILPNYLTNKKLNEIPFLPGDYFCYTLKSINHLVDCMEVYFNRKIPRDILIDSVKQLWEINDKNFERPSIKWSLDIQREMYGLDMKDILSEIISYLWCEKLQKDNLTYMDVIKSINNDRYPIYEIGKALKKVN